MVHQYWCSYLCSRTLTLKCRQQPLLHPCYGWPNSHIITICWWHLFHWRFCQKYQHHLSIASTNLWHGGFGIIDLFSWIGICQPDGFILTQWSYATWILVDFGLQIWNLAILRMIENLHLTKDMGGFLVDAHFYRRMVGKLNFLL
jgi:hypothetical protein